MLPRKSCSYSPKHVNTLGAPFGGATKTRNGISFCREKAPFTGLVTAKPGVFFCQPLALSLVSSSELEALVPFSADGKMFSNNPSD